MNQAALVKRLQSPGELNRNVKDLVQRHQVPVPYPIRQCAAVDIFGKDGYFIANRSEEPARRDVRMVRKSSFRKRKP